MAGKSHKEIISAETIHEMANLARITVPEADIPILVKQFSQIIEIFSILEKIDTSRKDNEIPSAPYPLRLRPDVERPSLDVNDALKASSCRDGRFIRVPKIIETGEGH